MFTTTLALSSDEINSDNETNNNKNLSTNFEKTEELSPDEKIEKLKKDRNSLWSKTLSLYSDDRRLKIKGGRIQGPREVDGLDEIINQIHNEIQDLKKQLKDNN